MSLQEQLRAQRAATEQWIRRREAELRRGASDLEARGRAVYAKAIKTGHDVLAKTPADVRRLGIAAATGRLPAELADTVARVAKPKVEAAARGAAKAVRAVASDDPKVRAAAWDAASQQGGAALRGAVDEFTFGLADRGSAAADALLDGGTDGFRERYKTEMMERRKADAADEANYGAARNIGRAVGFGTSLLATGGLGAGGAVARAVPGAARALKAVSKVTRLAPLPRGGLNTLTTVGGATAGVGSQLAADLVSGQRSSLGDYAAAGLGGVAGAFAMRAGAGRKATDVARAISDPRVAGAVEGASTEAAKALFDGRSASFEDLAESARAGAVGARIGNLLGKYGSNALPRDMKGALGEGLTVLRSRAAGEGGPLLATASPEFRQILPGAVEGPGIQRRIELTRDHTVADNITADGFVDEAKFGASARLSRAQRLARKELPPGHYRVNHWLPSDIGRMGAVGLAAPLSDLYAIRNEWER